MYFLNNIIIYIISGTNFVVVALAVLCVNSMLSTVSNSAICKSALLSAQVYMFNSRVRLGNKLGAS